MNLIKGLAVACLVTAVGIFELQNSATAAPPPGPPPGGGGDVVSVDCAAGTIQAAVDDAVGSTTIFITGTCTGQDVSITTDDFTLSGNEAGIACNKADPSISAAATIDGTVTVDGVRAKIEFLEITGSGAGVNIINRANVRLTCNDISNNDETGVNVVRSSNAVLRDNTLSENGQHRIDDPNVFFDCGLFALDASSVRSEGNTYKDNQYCAIAINRQAAFRNGAFLPGEARRIPTREMSIPRRVATRAREPVALRSTLLRSLLRCSTTGSSTCATLKLTARSPWKRTALSGLRPTVRCRATSATS